MILGQHVDCLVRNCALEPNETIEKMANFELIKNEGQSINWYHRSPEFCPYGRGNKIIDIEFKNGQLLCIKLPLETTDEQVETYLAPLSKLKRGSKNIILAARLSF